MMHSVYVLVVVFGDCWSVCCRYEAGEMMRGRIRYWLCAGDETGVCSVNARIRGTLCVMKNCMCECAEKCMMRI